MRPSRYHEHPYPEQWPGEEDVHGVRLGPRYATFGRDQVVYKAYPGDANTPDTSGVFFEFTVANGTDVVYQAVPMPAVGPPSDARIVMWWRRPRAVTQTMLRPYEFPWSLDTRIDLFETRSRRLAITGTVLAWQDPPYSRGATGYVLIDVEAAAQDAALINDLRRAWTTADW